MVTSSFEALRSVTTMASAKASRLVRFSRVIKRWRLDHMSLKKEPLQPMLTPG